MITSSHNPKIQSVRALQSQPKARRERQAFVVEGVRLAEEALASGWPAELVLYTGDLEPRGQAVVAGFVARGTPVEEVAPSVMRAASDTQTPQGILAVLSQRDLPLPDALDFVFIPDGVRDPGNLGSMLRTAAAAGAGAVWLPPGATDAFAPKVVRSGMGAHFRLPLRVCAWDEIGRLVRAAGLCVYLAAASEGLPYTQADFRQPVALVVGGEARGAGREALALAHQRVNIPMPGGAESLNAAAAAAILLFEVVRQRKEKL
jgi:TrmH family RNA methyltransferase